MGYDTYFSGSIAIKSKRAVEILKEEVKNNKELFFFDFDFKDGELDIHESWKDYNDEMMKICYFIALLDEQATGEITCEGDEREDNWKIVIENGRVEKLIGKIDYVSNGNFADTNVKEMVYKITGDKNLLKEIVSDRL